MKHKWSKVLFVIAMVLIVCFAAVGCDDTQNDNRDPEKYTVTYVLGDGATGTAPVLASQEAGAM